MFHFISNFCNTVWLPDLRHIQGMDNRTFAKREGDENKYDDLTRNIEE
jgi:hypothetical protein